MYKVPNKKIICNHGTTPNNEHWLAALPTNRSLDVWRHQRLEKEDALMRSVWPSATWSDGVWEIPWELNDD